MTSRLGSPRARKSAPPTRGSRLPPGVRAEATGNAGDPPCLAEVQLAGQAPRPARGLLWTSYQACLFIAAAVIVIASLLGSVR